MLDLVHAVAAQRAGRALARAAHSSAQRAQYRSEVAAPAALMARAVWDAAGRPVRFGLAVRVAVAFDAAWQSTLTDVVARTMRPVSA